MATIEERASKCYEEKYYGGNSTNLQCAYIKGATEQREIDVGKACELYREEVYQLKNMLNHFKKGAGDLIELERSVDIFRKAMEK